MSDLTALETLPPHDAPCPLEFVAAALAARDEVKRLRARVAEQAAMITELEGGYRGRCNYCHGNLKYCDTPRLPCLAKDARALLAAAPAQTNGGEG